MQISPGYRLYTLLLLLLQLNSFRKLAPLFFPELSLIPESSSKNNENDLIIQQRQSSNAKRSALYHPTISLNMHYTHIPRNPYINFSFPLSFSKVSQPEYSIIPTKRSGIKNNSRHNYSGRWQRFRVNPKESNRIDAEAATEPVCFGSMRIFLKVCSELRVARRKYCSVLPHPSPVTERHKGVYRRWIRLFRTRNNR